jgi:hypothetical protein
MNEERALGRLPSVFMAMILIACVAASATEFGRAQNLDQTPRLTERVGPEAVWFPTREVLLRIARECAGNGPGCLPTVMRQSGASAQAIDFATALRGEGYLTSFQRFGRVDLAIIAYPFQANDNEVPTLVNGRPPLVDVLRIAAGLALTGDTYFDSIAKAHPNAGWQGDVPRFKEMRPLPPGGQRFIFSFLLQDGCHACEALARTWLAMDFDASGTFQKPMLLGSTDLTATQPPQPAAQGAQRGVPAPAKPVPADRLLTDTSVGPVRVRMTIAQARAALRGFEVVRGTGGEGAVVYVVRRGTQTVMFLWPLGKNSWDPITELTRIHDIEVVNPSYGTTAGVHPGMPLQEVERIYGKLVKIQRSEIEAQEFASFSKLPPALRIRVAVGTGIFASGEMTTTRYVPSARVLSIRVRWIGIWPG